MFKKNLIGSLKNNEALIVISLAAGYLVSRLINLLTLPIFTDESIYLYWAKLIGTTHSQWFISLTDGKPPLLIWLLTVFLASFPANSYLLAGRLIVVLIGLSGLIAAYFLAKELFDRRAAVVVAILYLTSPFYLFHDRMVLFDSPLSAMLVLTVLFSVRMSKSSRVKEAGLSGFFLGLAFLFKPTALVILFLIPVVVFLLTKKKYLQTLVLTFLALLTGEVMNNLQRISHVYFLMDQKNSQFQQPLSQLIVHPLALFPNNFPVLAGWFIAYLTWPVFLLGLVSQLYLLVKKWRVGLAVLTIWLVPLVGFALIGRELFPRYILFITVYFFLPIGYFLSEVWLLKKWHFVSLLVLLVILIMPVIFDSALLFNPPSAPMPEFDYHQYISEHPSGYGLSKVLGFFDSKVSDSQPLYIVTQGTFGLYPYAFNLYYWNDPRVQILPVWPLTSVDPGLLSLNHDHPGRVYFVIKEYDTFPLSLPLREILQSEKPGGRYSIFIAQPK